MIRQRAGLIHVKLCLVLSHAARPAAAAHWHAEEQFWLGVFYFVGRGVTQEHRQAEERWLAAAAAQRRTRAMSARQELGR